MSQWLVRKALLSDGRLINILRGAEGENGPDDEEKKDENQNDDGTGGEGGEDDSGGAPKGTVSLEEYEKIRLRMQAADRAKSEAERRLKEIDDAGKSEVELLKTRTEELTKVNGELSARVQELARDNAFLKTNGVQWHNPSIALREINWENCTDTDGNVDNAALKREIDRIAKDNPYLVKTTTGSNTNDDKGKKGPSGHHPSGGGSGSNNDKNANRAALEKKYPALRR